MRIAGAIFIVLGLLLCLSLFGAVVGIPLILIGIVMVIVGGRRKTIITNVVQVSNNAPAPQLSVANGDTDWRREPSSRRPDDHEPRLRAPAVAVLPPQNAEFDLDYEADFVDVRSELSQVSKRILAMAKQDGYEFKARPDRILIRRGDFEEVLRSNQAVEEFGRTMRYL
jgi:hypothetical protein